MKQCWQPSKVVESLQRLVGDKEVKVLSVEETLSRAGDGMLVITFEESASKIQIPDRFMENSQFSNARYLSLLKALGIADRENLTNEDLIGRTVRVRVELEEYEGVQQPRIRKYLLPDESAQEPAQPSLG